MLISLKRSFEGVPILCKENQRTPQSKLPDDQALTNSFRHETFHIRELSIRTENSAKAFSFLNTRSDFLTVAAVAALLATPSAALGDSVSSASVAALPTHGDDVLEDHGGSILCPRAGHSAPS
jgi:hypothetical protein